MLAALQGDGSEPVDWRATEQHELGRITYALQWSDRRMSELRAARLVDSRAEDMLEQVRRSYQLFLAALAEYDAQAVGMPWEDYMRGRVAMLQKMRTAAESFARIVTRLTDDEDSEES